MLKKITTCIKYSKDEKDYLEDIKPYEGTFWSNPPKKNYPKKKMKELKTSIKERLEKVQGTDCAYCGLALGETSEAQIEHIAPKGVRTDKKTPLYPQFMFTKKNLVLACSFCNGFNKKGTEDTIRIYDDEYNKCKFKIVHPYFDDPRDHYDWAIDGDGILISFKSDEGEESINLFKLNEEQQTIARAKKFKQLDEKRKITPKDQELLDKIVEQN